ncbi:MAG: V-type ATP synthase subunit E [Patescibacteria group bacterium]|nr:V-type ATP synthase subunit E [Patescibacteria group bacterium]
MALQEIIKTLEQEHQTELEKINQETAATIKELENDFAKKIQAEKERILASVRQASGRRLDMDLFAQKSRHQQELLRKKREILSAVYSRALSKLSQLSPVEQEEFLLKMFKELPKQKGQLLTDKSQISLLEKAVKKSGLALSVAASQSELGAGFVWQGEDVDIDMTFAKIIDEIKSRTETEIGHELFVGQ